jgi:hypothetical protein
VICNDRTLETTTGVAYELEGKSYTVLKAIRHLKSILIPGETVECTAIQRRMFAIFHRRHLVAATNNRFIGLTRGVFGGFTPETIRWQDLKNIDITTGVFGAKIRVTALEHPDLASAQSSFVVAFSGLRKAETQSVYRICQAEEQAWREKRRLRELEEMRAKSGGFQLSSGPMNNSQTGSEQDPTTRLAHAKNMLDQNLISDSEYHTIKAQILSRL